MNKPMQDVINELWEAERERRRYEAERIVESGTKEEINALFQPLCDAIRNQHGTPIETA